MVYLGYTRVLLLGILFTCYYGDITSGCSCKPSHPQQDFCDADFVIKGRVIVKEIFDSGSHIYNKKYTLDLITEYKTSALYDSVGDKTHIWTIDDPNDCGIVAKVGVQHLFAGFVLNDKLTIMECAWYGIWKKIPAAQKTFLEKGKYAKQCNRCSVNVCTDYESCYGVSLGSLPLARAPRADVCVLYNKAIEAQCVLEYAPFMYCYRNNKQTVRFWLPDINQFGIGKNQDA